MENSNKDTKILRKVNINPFLTNLGEISISYIFIAMIFTFFSVLSAVMCVFYWDGDYYSTLSLIEKDMNIILVYFVSNLLSVFNNINLLNEFIGSNVFNFDFKSTRLPPFDLEGYLMIGLSIFITIKIYFLTIIQIKAQRQIKSIGFQNYYIPFVFIFKFLRKKKNKKLYIKLIDILKLEPLNPKNRTQVDLILQTMFNVKYEELEQFTIRIVVKDYLGWYHFQVWELIPQEPKKSNKKESKLEDDNKPKRLTRQEKKALKDSVK